MKTPKEYIKNLKNGIITDEMISDVLFSYSKRAKNYRDNARELRNFYKRNRYVYDEYDSVEKNTFKKEVLYERKSDILKLYEDKFLKCIHIQDKGATRRIYDYDPEFKKVCDSEDVVWSNCYYDHELEEEVWFVDVLKKNKEYLYFLYYEFQNRSFHSPIEREEAEKYVKEKNLEMIELDDLTTFGEDVGLLLSLQFCDKVYKTLFPEKTVYSISQPIKVGYKFENGYGCRFYTDEEIKECKEEKIRKAEIAKIEKEKRQEERRIKREEEKRLKKIEDERHKEELTTLLVKDKTDDWTEIKKHIKPHKDAIFNKIFKRLSDERKHNISESCWNYIQEQNKTEKYDILRKSLKTSPKVLRDLMDSVIIFVTTEDTVSENHSSFEMFDFTSKCIEAYRNMVKTMVEYNEGLTKDEGKIHFVKDCKKRICFCNVPMFGNMYTEPKYNFDQEMSEIFLTIENRKEFNKRYQCQFTIKKRLNNRISVGYEKFKNEVKKLNNTL